MARNQVASPEDGFCDYADDPGGQPEVAKVNSIGSQKSFSRRYMPSSRSFRNAPGKASKAASRSASKMASAVVSTGKKFRFRSSKSSSHGEDSNLAQVLGSQDERLDLLEDNEDGDELYHNGEDNEDIGSSLYPGQTSSYSTPSTDRPTDMDCLDRSDHSCGQRSDTSGSDSDAREKHLKVPTIVTKPQPAEWNHKAFQNFRPLACDSIWDIPTSRLPQPEPRPEPSSDRVPREQQRGKIEAFGSDSLPPLPAQSHNQNRRSSFGGGRMQLPKIAVANDMEAGSSPSARRAGHGPLRYLCIGIVIICAAGGVIASATHFL